MRGGEFRVLAINPGSTSLKLAVFEGDETVWTRTLLHADGEMRGFRGRPVLEQLEFRAGAVRAALEEWGAGAERLDAVVGRGGLLRPLPSGTYRVNAEMLEELRRVGKGQEHAANLGAFLAEDVAGRCGCPAFVVDPVSVDELSAVARVSGTALLERQSLSHALNTKAVARRYAREHGTAYADLRLVVAHLGSGISVSAHAGGRMIDVNLGGQEGPFSTERCGGLQLTGIVGLCFSGRYTERQLWDVLIREGGLYSYLGTRDLDEVERRVAAGDGEAALIYDAMVYQIAKEIGAMATVLEGRVDAILATGGMAKSAKLVGQLREAVGWIAPVAVYPGEDELRALAEGALRVLRGEEAARTVVGEAAEVSACR